MGVRALFERSFKQQEKQYRLEDKVLVLLKGNFLIRRTNDPTMYKMYPMNGYVPGTIKGCDEKGKDFLETCYKVALKGGTEVIVEESKLLPDPRYSEDK